MSAQKVIKHLAEYFLLYGVLFFLASYIAFPCVRLFLIDRKIDPSFLATFLTALTLTWSIIQNRKDKKFFYNSKLADIIEEHGMMIVGKLLRIKKKSRVFLITIEGHKEAIDTQRVYEDVMNSVDTSELDNDMDTAAAYVCTYFPEVSDYWNDMMDKLNELGNLNAEVVINYQKNREVVMSGNHKKIHALATLDEKIRKAINLDKEVENISLEITEKIVKKINEFRGAIRKTL